MEKENEELTFIPEKDGIVNEQLTPTKNPKLIVNKSMSIGEQIRAQATKKGRKTYIINDEESLDWFIKNYVAPEFSKKSYI